MKKIYGIICGKYKKLYLFFKTVISIICGVILKGSKRKKIFQEGESIEILKILGLIKNMEKENASLDFRLKKIETRNSI